MQVTPQLVEVRRRPEEVRVVGERIDGVRRLLVARTDRLGDVVLSLPAVQALRAAYPEAHLGLLVADPWVPLIAGLAGVDEVVGAGGSPGERTRRMTRFRADLAVCISRDKDLAWSARMARIGRRVGTGRRFHSALYTDRVEESRRAGARHEVEYALSFAHRAGAPAGPATFGLAVDPSAAGRVDAFLARETEGRAPVVIHPGSGGSCPRWPLPLWIETGRALAADGRPVVFSLGPRENGWRARILDESGMPAPAIFDGPLPELAALCARAALVLGNSSGPLHLAAALDRPVLAVHAPWPSCAAARWGPYSARGRAMELVCAEALDWSDRERRRYVGALMAELRPERMTEAARELLAQPA